MVAPKGKRGQPKTLTPRGWSVGAKSQDANAVSVLAGPRIDKNVLPCLVDEGVWILHDPYLLTVIAHQDHALGQPFGVTDAGAAAEALRDTRLFPWLDVGPSAAIVAHPPTQRGGFRVHPAERHDHHCEHDADLNLHCKNLTPDGNRPAESDLFKSAQWPDAPRFVHKFASGLAVV